MSDVTEDLRILYRAVGRRQGRSIDYAGCVTADEALRLMQMGLAKIVDVQAEDDRAGVETDNHAGNEADGSSAARLPIPGAIQVLLPAPRRNQSKTRDLECIARPEGVDATLSLIDSLRLLAGNNDILMFVSRSGEASHAAATMAARAGFYCALNVIDGRECFHRSGALE